MANLAEGTNFARFLARVETSHGQVLVAHSGDLRKPAILTYHDLGLNYISNFQVR